VISGPDKLLSQFLNTVFTTSDHRRNVDSIELDVFTSVWNRSCKLRRPSDQADFLGQTSAVVAKESHEGPVQPTADT
jgi:hypothetical protein